jgi:aromatic ring-opening dioxygenase catalytic subunit (LigB family)
MTQRGSTSHGSVLYLSHGSPEQLKGINLTQQVLWDSGKRIALIAAASWRSQSPLTDTAQRPPGCLNHLQPHLPHAFRLQPVN